VSDFIDEFNKILGGYGTISKSNQKCFICGVDLYGHNYRYYQGKTYCNACLKRELGLS
jgi:formylmethanofuran dehydrogenase subunit E